MDMEDFGNDSCNEQPSYVPTELVSYSSNTCNITYYCYLIELRLDFNYDIPIHDIVLAMRSELDSEITSTSFDMCVDRGNMSVNLRHVETIHLSPDEVQKCRRFQTTLFRILLDCDMNKITNVSDEFSLGDNPEIDYLLLPATAKQQRPSNSIVDWKAISSFPFSSESKCECEDHAHDVWTKNGLVCSCKLRNCVVSTSHNGFIYIITGEMELNGNSHLRHLRGKRATTYKEYFKNKHRIELHFEDQPLLHGRSVFKVNNYLLRHRQKKEKGPSKSSVELPPEICSIIMSPISVSTIYSFSFIPSIMHRLESLLVAFNLKKMLLDHCTQNDIPICKVMQAITTKECQEAYDYDSLETLGDSFLKYAASQQLFKTNQNHREGTLTKEREKMISNVALFEYGCSRRLPGFIQKGIFDPQQWIIPGDKSKSLSLKEEFISSRTRVYVCGTREIKSKVVADVVEALIGAFISTGDEEAAISFMNWIGIKVDTNIIPYKSHLSFAPEKLVKVNLLESLLNYSFQDPSLLVEALTHGSYKRQEIPRCYNYQRLEFLGDAVLDYVITMHFYNEYLDDKLSSEFLTDMRSISVNNECYALSTIKAKLHEHILCDSEVEKQIAATLNGVNKLSLKYTFGWELEAYFCEVLADVIESIAGAIFIDSGHKKVVFQSIRPLLEPLVTPETVKKHPVRELKELCQREQYKMKDPVVSLDMVVTSVTIEVEANGIIYKHTAKASNKFTAQKVASKEVLKLLKVMQAITTKECQEAYDYDSLETLGDSFLKYAASQQLFKTNQNHREGTLTKEREKMISNVALFEYGCSRRLPGFIQKGIFDPQQWIIPGDKSKSLSLKEEFISSRTRVYVCGTREIKSKVVADVVEALIGAFISTGDEEAAISFMNWIGIKVDTNIIPYKSHLSFAPEKLVKVNLLESLLNYSFQDPSLLVEALTHGSYKRQEIPRCYNYQRLEFLGDAVLDYVITMHFYNEYLDDKLSSEFLTDMRSISVNNECYALSTIKAKLHEHILCDSEVEKQIAATLNGVNKLSLKYTFGWELEAYFCEVLADVIESIAGAIFIDSGHKKVVFQSIRPLLEPLVTPETVKKHPVRELKELCQREQYKMKDPVVSLDMVVTSVTIEVEANGIIYKHTAKASNKFTAQKVASKEVLKLLKVTSLKLSMNKRFLFPLLSVVFLFCWFVNEIIYHVVSK